MPRAISFAPECLMSLKYTCFQYAMLFLKLKYLSEIRLNRDSATQLLVSKTLTACVLHLPAPTPCLGLSQL